MGNALIFHQSSMMTCNMVSHLFSIAIFCLYWASSASAEYDLVLHDEYLGFGEWADVEDYPIDDMSSVLANKQMHIRCFPNLHHDESRKYVHNGFYVSTVDKVDFGYGIFKIRAKLPTKVLSSLNIALVDSSCKPPSCPPGVVAPGTIMTATPSQPTKIGFHLMHESTGKPGLEQRTVRKLPKYTDSYHTYELRWMPWSLEWRIDGKVVAGFSDPRMVPRKRMALQLYAFCGDHSEQQYKNSGLTISSLTYTALPVPRRRPATNGQSRRRTAGRSSK